MFVFFFCQYFLHLSKFCAYFFFIRNKLILVIKMNFPLWKMFKRLFFAFKFCFRLVRKSFLRVVPNVKKQNISECCEGYEQVGDSCPNREYIVDCFHLFFTKEVDQSFTSFWKIKQSDPISGLRFYWVYTFLKLL